MSIREDMLRGASQISDFTGFEKREIYRCHVSRELPTFKVGNIICARKSELSARLSGNVAAAK